MVDQSISEEQKQALVRIYLSFRREYEEEHSARPVSDASVADPAAADRSAPDRSAPDPSAPGPSAPSEPSSSKQKEGPVSTSVTP